MPALELEQFVDRGAIRAWWGLAWRTVAGLAAGAVLGQQLAAVLYGSGWQVGVLTLVGATVGCTLMLQRRGLILGKRLLIWLAFLYRRMRGLTIVDGRAYGVPTLEADEPIMIVRLRAPDDNHMPEAEEVVP